MSQRRSWEPGQGWVPANPVPPQTRGHSLENIHALAREEWWFERGVKEGDFDASSLARGGLNTKLRPKVWQSFKSNRTQLPGVFARFPNDHQLIAFSKPTRHINVKDYACWNWRNVRRNVSQNPESSWPLWTFRENVAHRDYLCYYGSLIPSCHHSLYEYTLKVIL